jgi:hypothetical protein
VIRIAAEAASRSGDFQSPTQFKSAVFKPPLLEVCADSTLILSRRPPTFALLCRGMQGGG